MATMNVSLPEPMKEWVESQVNGGKYSNSSDYVRDLIRRDQSAHDRREKLLLALLEGERSGMSDKDIAQIWNEVKTRSK